MLQEAERDERVCVMGEGVRPHGSYFKQTEGVSNETGPTAEYRRGGVEAFRDLSIACSSLDIVQ